MANYNILIDAQEGVYPVSLGTDFSPSHIEVNENGDGEIVIIEHLGFHENYIGRKITQEDLEQLLLTLVSYLPKFMNAQDNLMVEFDGDNEFSTSLFIGNTAGKSLDEIVVMYWDFFAVVNNILDPGSFGWEYAF